MTARVSLKKLSLSTWEAHMGRQGIGVVLVPPCESPQFKIYHDFMILGHFLSSQGVCKRPTHSCEFAKTVQGPEHVMKDPTIASSSPVLSSFLKNNGS